MQTAYMYYDDGRRWLRVQDETGLEWDEPISGWTIVLDLIRGGPVWFEHKDGRKIPEKETPCNVREGLIR